MTEEGKINNDDNEHDNNNKDDNDNDNDNDSHCDCDSDSNSNSDDMQFQVAQGSLYPRRQRDYSSHWVTVNAIQLIQDYDNDARVSLNTIRHEILLDRLLISRLRPVETEKVGNCFFRAIAQMIYGDDNLHRVSSGRHVCFNHSLNVGLDLPRFAHALIL